MDAAVPVDAQNASTATWKTAQNAVSHSAHTHHRQHALHTKNLTLPCNLRVFASPLFELLRALRHLRLLKLRDLYQRLRDGDGLADAGSI